MREARYVSLVIIPDFESDNKLFTTQAVVQLGYHCAIIAPRGGCYVSMLHFKTHTIQHFLAVVVSKGVRADHTIILLINTHRWGMHGTVQEDLGWLTTVLHMVDIHSHQNRGAEHIYQCCTGRLANVTEFGKINHNVARKFFLS
jgi:hypothetical protein